MVATLILLLVTAGVTSGMQLALVQYNRSMIQSESKILCSTLESVITNELSNTNTDSVKLGTSDTNIKPLEGFFSKYYATEDLPLVGFYSVELDPVTRKYKDIAEGTVYNPDTYGKVMLGTINGRKFEGKLILSSSAYSSFDLGANVKATYDTSKKVFHVTLSIADKTNTGTYEEIIYEEFDVIPLNQV